jgi:hypothetical protein
LRRRLLDKRQDRGAGGNGEHDSNHHDREGAY